MQTSASKTDLIGVPTARFCSYAAEKNATRLFLETAVEEIIMAKQFNVMTA